jgi:hypothetical protein
VVEEDPAVVFVVGRAGVGEGERRDAVVVGFEAVEGGGRAAALEGAPLEVEEAGRDLEVGPGHVALPVGLGTGAYGHRGAVRDAAVVGPGIRPLECTLRPAVGAAAWEPDSGGD